MTTINNKRIQFDEQSVAPATPPTGKWLLYAKATGLFVKDDAGVETPLDSGGGFTSFNVAGSTGTPQTITDGNTLSILGGTGIGTVASATDTVTINFNGLSLTTETIQVEKLLANTALSSNGTFDIDLSSGEALNCKHLRIVMLVRGTVSAQVDDLYVYFNNDTTNTNYWNHEFFVVTTTLSANQNNNPFVAKIAGNTAEANNFTPVEMFIPDFRNTTKEKVSRSIFNSYTSTSASRTGMVTHQWQNTNAITRLQIRVDGHSTDQLLAGSEIWVYGLKSVDVVTNVTVL